MLKKFISLVLLLLFLMPVHAETFSFSGGSGRVEIVCDGVELRDGGAWAAIRFVSTSHSKTDYRYVRIGDDMYYPDENGQFVIPVRLGENTEIVGMTAKMSAAHEINYTLFVQLDDAALPGLEPVEEIPTGAQYLTLTQCENGIVLASVTPPECMEQTPLLYLLADDPAAVPAGLEKQAAVIPVPVERPVSVTQAAALSDPDYKSLIRNKTDLVLVDAGLLNDGTLPAFQKFRDRLETLGIPLLLDRRTQEAEADAWAPLLALLQMPNSAEQ